MDIRLPKLGEGVDSGSVVSLLVKEGDVIAQGQTILELENEKAVAPIPSPAAGRVSSIRVKPGDKLNVGQVILTLGDASAEAPKSGAPSGPKPKPAAAKARPAPEPEPPPAPESGEATETEPDTERAHLASTKAGFPPPAAPSIRRLAKDLGIDLTRVRGSERGGRIVLRDLRAYVQHLQQVAFRQKKEAPAPAAAESVDFAQWGPVSTKPMSPLRQVISRRLSESWRTIPHVTQFDSADVTHLNELRQRYAAAYEGKGARLTLTSFLLKAVVGCLRTHPMFNASLDEATQSVVFKEYFHIGLAVDTEAGLVVPVLRDVDSKSVLQLSREVQELAEKARERKLSGDDMTGGTFTISNQGGIGSAHFTPIINRPEVAILGLGRAARQPVWLGDKPVPRMLLPLALSYDHRLIDGGAAARFMVDLVQAIQEFPEDQVKI